MARFPICTMAEIPPGKMKCFKVKGHNVLVYHLEDGFYATQHRCPHFFSALSKGKLIDGCKIECSSHRARFDIRTGKVIQWANSPPGIQFLTFFRKEKPLRTYPVTIEDEQLVLDLDLF